MTDALKATLDSLRIARAANERLTTDDGETYIDLFCGSGTVWLGHCNPAILAGLQEQLGRVWNTGILPTSVHADARAQIESFFPPSHTLAGLYSTGMEAAEFALRCARVATGRGGVIGFGRNTHGKSLATASLGWQNEHVNLPDVHRLPSVPDCPESEILERLDESLADRTVGAVFVEPIQANGGGCVASPAFHQALSQLCSDRGTLLVCDEILTGFHRTGGPFLFESLGVTPDIVLIGKAMGNGFPVSGVVVHRRHRIVPAMLPGSTYANNPLAAAVVVATLKQMGSLPLRSLVAEIGDTIQAELEPALAAGIALRGMGALWMLEFPSEVDTTAVAVHTMQRGVVVSPAGRWLRLFPPATIPLDRLRLACGVIRDSCLAWSRKDLTPASR